MVYYELYGIPGAGKTTVTKSLLQQLKEDGYKIAGFDEVYYRRDFKLRSLKAYVEILFHISEYPLLYHYLMLYNKCSCRNRHYFMKLILYSHQILMTCKENKYDMMFLEEGIIQFISSMFYMEELPANNNIQRIAGYFSKRIKVVPIYCDVEIKESMKRIKERPYSQTSRFSHSVGTEKLEEALKYKIHNLGIVASHFLAHYKINMEEPVEHNVERLHSLINGTNK